MEELLEAAKDRARTVIPTDRLATALKHWEDSDNVLRLAVAGCSERIEIWDAKDLEECDRLPYTEFTNMMALFNGLTKLNAAGDEYQSLGEGPAERLKRLGNDWSDAEAKAALRKHPRPSNAETRR